MLHHSSQLAGHKYLLLASQVSTIQSTISPQFLIRTPLKHDIQTQSKPQPQPNQTCLRSTMARSLAGEEVVRQATTPHALVDQVTCLLLPILRTRSLLQGQDLLNPACTPPLKSEALLLVPWACRPLPPIQEGSHRRLRHRRDRAPLHRRACTAGPARVLQGLRATQLEIHRLNSRALIRACLVEQDCLLLLPRG